MSEDVETNTVGLNVQSRIQELEGENRRLSAELEKQKHLVETLQESERRFRTMADGTPFINWVTDANGQMEFINQAYSQFFGVTLEQVQSKSWQMLIHPDDRARYTDTYMNCLRERLPFQAEARILRKDGQWRWVISAGQPRFSEQGTFLGMAGSSLDVTEHMDTTKALRESEMKFRGAFENAAIGYALQTPEGRFLDANSAYCNLAGYSIDELRSMKIAQLIHPEDHDEHTQLIDRLRTGAIPNFVVESRYLRKNGDIVWVRKSCSLVTGEDGDPKWMLALIEDISDRKQAEQSLRDSEQLYRVIGEAIPYGVWICDPAGRNLYASQSFLDLVGMTQEECSEFGWANVLHPEDVERTLAAWKECIRTEGTWDVEHRYLGKDGSYHPILARGIPVRNEEGRIIYWAGINLDISWIKKAEQAMLDHEIQIERQKELITKREQERLLIAQDIHDGPIQTLAATILELQMGKIEFASLPVQKRLDNLEGSIRHAVQELRNIIAALRPPLLQRFGLSQAIRVHADELNDRHPGLELVHNVAEDKDRLDEAVCLSLFRIYQEALSNVVRHSGATRAEIRFSFVDNLAVLEIEDNGRGMKVEPDLTKWTAEYHFGLAGMKERADAINGEFQVRSAPGKGTTVAVKVPVNTVTRA